MRNITIHCGNSKNKLELHRPVLYHQFLRIMTIEDKTGQSKATRVRLPRQTVVPFETLRHHRSLAETADDQRQLVTRRTKPKRRQICTTFGTNHVDMYCTHAVLNSLQLPYTIHMYMQVKRVLRCAQNCAFVFLDTISTVDISF